MHKIGPLLKGLLKVAVVLALLLIALPVAMYLSFGNQTKSHSSASQDVDVITFKRHDGTLVEGKEKEEMLERYLQLKTLNEHLKKASGKELTDAERHALFEQTWKEIKSRMVDPAPGTYPVKLLGPAEGVFLYYRMDVGDFSSHSEWLDERYVMYWGLTPSGFPNRTFSDRINERATLIILDTETGEVQELDRHTEGNRLCFDPDTKNISYVIYRGIARGNNYAISSVVYGHLDSAMRFIREDEDTFDLTKSYLDEQCRYREWEDKRKLGRELKHGDGWVRLKRDAGGMESPGYLILTRPDGTTKEIFVENLNGPSFNYDPHRDQYFVARTYSMKDQRSYVQYFSRDLDFIEEIVFPRVLFQDSFPDASFSGYSFSQGHAERPRLSAPVKDGFVLNCGSRADAQRKKDSDGDPFRQYLCHVKKDGTIVRAVTGPVYSLSVSPSGCRVFGFWKEYSNDDRITGKNFVVDLCKQPMSEKGE